MTEQWILHQQAQDYAVVITTKYKDLQGWADCVDWFIKVVKQTDYMYIVPVRAIVQPVHAVQDIAASCTICSIWLQRHHVDVDSY